MPGANTSAYKDKKCSPRSTDLYDVCRLKSISKRTGYRFPQNGFFSLLVNNEDDWAY